MAYGESVLRALHRGLGAEEQSLKLTSIPKLLKGVKQLQKSKTFTVFRQALFLLGQLIPSSDTNKLPRADPIKQPATSTYQDNWRLCLGTAGAKCNEFKPFDWDLLDQQVKSEPLLTASDTYFPANLFPPRFVPTAVVALMSPDYFDFFEVHKRHLQKKYQLNTNSVNELALLILCFEKIIASSPDDKLLIDTFSTWKCSDTGLKLVQEMRQQSDEADTPSQALILGLAAQVCPSRGETTEDAMLNLLKKFTPESELHKPMLVDLVGNTEPQTLEDKIGALEL